MANNIPGFKTDLGNAFTANFDATTRTNMANAVVTKFQAEWSIRVATGTVDNATNRAIFARDKVFDIIKLLVEDGSRQALAAAIVPNTIV